MSGVQKCFRNTPTDPSEAVNSPLTEFHASHLALPVQSSIPGLQNNAILTKQQGAPHTCSRATCKSGCVMKHH